MRKKVDKIDLKSNTFKLSKTPDKKPIQSSRSPPARSPGYQSIPQIQKFDPNDLFQKVCCPNCKYLFKIIKNNQVPYSTGSIKKESKQSVFVQTDRLEADQLKRFSKMQSSVSQQLNPKMSESFIFKTRLIKQNLNKMLQSQQNQYIKSSTFQIESRSPFKNDRSRKVSFIASDKKSQNSFIQPQKSKTSNKVLENVNSSFEPLPTLNKQAIQSRLKRQISYQLSSDLPDLITSSLRNQKVVQNISETFRQLPSTVELSAVTKMLMRDYQKLGNQHKVY